MRNVEHVDEHLEQVSGDEGSSAGEEEILSDENVESDEEVPVPVPKSRPRAHQIGGRVGGPRGRGSQRRPREQHHHPEIVITMKGAPPRRQESSPPRRKPIVNFRHEQASETEQAPASGYRGALKVVLKRKKPLVVQGQGEGRGRGTGTRKGQGRGRGRGRGK